MSENGNGGAKCYKLKQALLRAVDNGDNAAVGKLLNNQIIKNVIDSKNKFGRTALHTAVLNGNIEVVKLLVSKGASLDTTDKQGRTPEELASDLALRGVRDPSENNVYAPIVLLFKEQKLPRNDSAAGLINQFSQLRVTDKKLEAADSKQSPEPGVGHPLPKQEEVESQSSFCVIS